MEKMHEFSDIILVINFSVVDKWTNKSNSGVTATAKKMHQSGLSLVLALPFGIRMFVRLQDTGPNVCECQF